jgi:hypothetical protein
MRRTLFLAALLTLGVSACASSQNIPPTRMAGVAPMLSVERFLQAANTSDLEAMARIFGTSSGAIAEQTGNPFGCAFKRIGSWVGLGSRCVSRQQIELRMNAIALVLRHNDYRIRNERDVPGRRAPTTRVGVDLVQGSSTVTDVPFVVVRTSNGRWLVEEIGLERVTSRP